MGISSIQDPIAPPLVRPGPSLGAGGLLPKLRVGLGDLLYWVATMAVQGRRKSSAETVRIKSCRVKRACACVRAMTPLCKKNYLGCRGRGKNALFWKIQAAQAAAA